MCGTDNADGVNGTNGTNGLARPHPRSIARNPYNQVTDYISNVNNFAIIESTLREGEQFANRYV
jgi:homocitrate synthase